MIAYQSPTDSVRSRLPSAGRKCTQYLLLCISLATHLHPKHLSCHPSPSQAQANGRRPLARMTSPAAAPDCAFLPPPLYLAACLLPACPRAANSQSDITANKPTRLRTCILSQIVSVLKHLQSHCSRLECFQMINSFCFLFKERSDLCDWRRHYIVQQNNNNRM